MKIPAARRGLTGGVVAACLLAVPIAAAGAAPSATGGTADPAASSPSADRQRLPLGPSTLEETRRTRQLAPGLKHVAIERGHAPTSATWTVTVGLGTTEDEVAALERQVRDAGYEPRRDATSGPDPRKPHDGPLGWMVRVGRYADEKTAQDVRDKLVAKGVSTAAVQSTGEDGGATTGPWSLDALIVDPARFRGRLGSELATKIVPGRETTSSIAKRTGALAAVNGGFFVIAGKQQTPGPWTAGVDGDPAGVSVVDGKLVSEAVNGRPALVVPTDSGAGASVRRLRTHLSARAEGGASREVTGLNREPGLVVNCGGVGDATPFSHPAHDYTCGNRNEVVAFTPAFGTDSPKGEGYEAAVDGTGKVTAVHDGRGGTIPAGGRLLQGTGTGADWLREHARPGTRLVLSKSVADATTGAPVPLSPQTSIVNGGPLLLRDGRTALDPVRDGWSPEDIGTADRAGFYNGWYLRRNPRTAAGVTKDGRIILLTADGRRPGHSAGLSITETAEVMRSLGAVDAINLDGGGSTAMAVGDTLQGIPSDSTGERADAEALVLLPPPGRRE